MKTILIVDDDAGLRNFFERAFRRNFDVEGLTAQSGEEAYNIFAENWSIDYILADNSMANGTGIELIEGIRDYDADIPITLMGGANPTLKEQELLKKHNVRFLLKPFDVVKEFEGIFERRPNEN